MITLYILSNLAHHVSMIFPMTTGFLLKPVTVMIVLQPKETLSPVTAQHLE